MYKKLCKDIYDVLRNPNKSSSNFMHAPSSTSRGAHFLPAIYNSKVMAAAGYGAVSSSKVLKTSSPFDCLWASVYDPISRTMCRNEIEPGKREEA
jgi:hypothetical protein